MAQPVETELTIVIVSWNTRQLLRDCLASLPAAVADLTTRIVVVDNKSDDGSADMVRTEFPAVEVIESGGNIGFARGNNLVLRTVASRAVLLLNPDTICPPGSLDALYEQLQSAEGVAAVGPTLLDDNRQPTASFGVFPSLEIHIWNILDPAHLWRPLRLRGKGLGCVPIPYDTPNGMVPVDYLKGACLMITRQALEEVGLLDERFFMYFEETDWCRRAHQAGHRLLLVPGVSIVHLEGGAAARASAFSLSQFQLSYRLFLIKHHSKSVVWKFRVAQLIEYTGKAFLRGLRCWSDRDRILAANYLAIARLQLQPNLECVPPGSSKPNQS